MLKCWLCFLFFLVCVPSVKAQELVVRGLYPNPVTDEQNEWILIENQQEASIAAQSCLVNDTVGSVKQASLPAMSAGQLLKLSRSASGITLNNSQDSVELTCEGEMVAQTALYEQIGEDQVWWLSNQGHWLIQNITDFLERLHNRNWDEEAEPEEVVVGVTQPENNDEATNSAKVEEKLQPEQKISIQEKESTTIANAKPELDYQKHLQLPAVSSSLNHTESSHEATVEETTRAAQLEYPQIDREQELAQFKAWKREALTGSLSLIFAGGCWLMISVPPLWSWYNEKRLLW